MTKKTIQNDGIYVVRNKGQCVLIDFSLLCHGYIDKCLIVYENSVHSISSLNSYILINSKN